MLVEGRAHSLHHTLTPTSHLKDYYPDEGTFAGTVELYQEYVYPLLGEHQKMLFVPPAYSANTTALRDQLCCNNATRDGANPPCSGNCTTAMLQWARDSYEWARTDPHLIGLNPWHWNSGAPGRFEPGMSGLPAVAEAWRQIGREIVSQDLRPADQLPIFATGPSSGQYH